MLNATQPTAGTNSRLMVPRRLSLAATCISSVAACALPAASSVAAAEGSARSLATWRAVYMVEWVWAQVRILVCMGNF